MTALKPPTVASLPHPRAGSAAGSARELHRRERDPRAPARTSPDGDLRLRAARRRRRRRVAGRSRRAAGPGRARAERRLRRGRRAAAAAPADAGAGRDRARVRAAAAAVRAADRGKPRRSGGQPLRDLRAAARLLQLSAAPVGAAGAAAIFGAATPERVALSDRVCAGLQVVEHLQDIAEDHRRGRVYMPREDLARFGCGEQDLDSEPPSAPLQALIEFESARARALLSSGAPLARTLPPAPRIAVAGFAAGGLRALDALAPGPPASPRLRPAPAADSGRPMTSPAIEVEYAYRECEQITRRQAANFYYGIRLLPRFKRQAMCADLRVRAARRRHRRRGPRVERAAGGARARARPAGGARRGRRSTPATR